MTDRGSATDRILRRWRRLDRGWRAIHVSVLLVGTIVGLDLPIPW